MKQLLVLLLLISTASAQLSTDDFYDGDYIAQWERDWRTKVIGQRIIVVQITKRDFFVSGMLNGQAFIGIQSDNGQEGQTLVHLKNISAAHLERMRYLAYVEKEDVQRLLQRNKRITVTRLYGNSISGYRELSEKIELKSENGKLAFYPINDLAEVFPVTLPVTFK